MQDNTFAAALAQYINQRGFHDEDGFQRAILDHVQEREGMKTIDTLHVNVIDGSFTAVIGEDIFHVEVRKEKEQPPDEFVITMTDGRTYFTGGFESVASLLSCIERYGAIEASATPLSEYKTIDFEHMRDYIVKIEDKRI